MRVTRSAARLGSMLLGLGLCMTIYQAYGNDQSKAGVEPAITNPVAVGYEIFNREWMPNDPRGHGGDGLGPVYNDSSCIACHNSGGSGGAGPISKNIDIMSASRNLGMPVQAVATPFQATSTNAQCKPAEIESSDAAAAALNALDPIHPGFRTSRNVVLHKFGTDPNYDAWRSQSLSGPAPTQAVAPPQALLEPIAPSVQVFDLAVANSAVIQFNPGNQLNGVRRRSKVLNGGAMEDQSGDSRAMMRIQQIQASIFASNPTLRQGSRSVGPFLVSRSQRNPTPLFGLGLIDSIPEEAIDAMEKREAKESPETKGRVSHVKDNRIGRLGWKGQVASVEDFVLNACAVELGLEVPGHHQAMTPQAPKYRTTGLDLTGDECNALVAYVKSLPKPAENRPASAEESKVHGAGKATFTSIGCANCHAAKVGNVVGMYSDLLIHDMGQDLGDDGSYTESSDGDDEPLVPRFSVADGQPVQQPTPAAAPRPPKGATRTEWRTPPLWGFRDSGPYLHDGRAQTLEQAVAMHGGQGQASAVKFFSLSPRERLQVESFLKSLVAPPSDHFASR
jgi:CxxC motif-containing protein (DUF1111 family)